jgi:hypothetical protein
MTFETVGLLVPKDMASFQIVQELTGGLLLMMMWRKIERRTPLGISFQILARRMISEVHTNPNR